MTLVNQVFKAHTGKVLSVAFSPDDRLIVSGAADNTICLWGSRTGDPIGEPLKGHTNWVRSVAFSPDGKWIVSGSYDTSVCLWDASTGQMIGSPRIEHDGKVLSVAFSPDGRSFVSGSTDKTICPWDMQHNVMQTSCYFEGYTGSVQSVAFSPDSERLVSGSHDKTVCLWDVHAGMQLGSPLKAILTWYFWSRFRQMAKELSLVRMTKHFVYGMQRLVCKLLPSKATLLA